MRFFLWRWWKLKIIWKTWHFIGDYGPDGAEVESRDMSIEDMCRRAFHRWGEEGFYLLPRRYERIMQEIIAEGHFTQAEYNARPQETVVIFISEDGELLTPEGTKYLPQPATWTNPWDDEDIFAKLSPSLQHKITQYEEDGSKFIRSTEIAIFWMHHYELEFP